MLRISEPLYSLIIVDSPRYLSALRQSTDARSCGQPRAQDVVADRVVQLRQIHGNRSSGLAAVADACEDHGVARWDGAPQSSLLIGEYALAAGRAVCRTA